MATFTVAGEDIQRQSVPCESQDLHLLQASPPSSSDSTARWRNALANLIRQLRVIRALRSGRCQRQTQDCTLTAGAEMCKLLGDTLRSETLMAQTTRLLKRVDSPVFMNPEIREIVLNSAVNLIHQTKVATVNTIWMNAALPMMRELESTKAKLEDIRNQFQIMRQQFLKDVSENRDRCRKRSTVPAAESTLVDEMITSTFDPFSTLEGHEQHFALLVVREKLNMIFSRNPELYNRASPSQIRTISEMLKKHEAADSQEELSRVRKELASCREALAAQKVLVVTHKRKRERLENELARRDFGAPHLRSQLELSLRECYKSREALEQREIPREPVDSLGELCTLRAALSESNIAREEAELGMCELSEALEQSKREHEKSNIARKEAELGMCELRGELEQSKVEHEKTLHKQSVALNKRSINHLQLIDDWRARFKASEQTRNELQERLCHLEQIQSDAGRVESVDLKGQPSSRSTACCIGIQRQSFTEADENGNAKDAIAAPMNFDTPLTRRPFGLRRYLLADELDRQCSANSTPPMVIESYAKRGIGMLPHECQTDCDAGVEPYETERSITDPWISYASQNDDSPKQHVFPHFRAPPYERRRRSQQGFQSGSKSSASRERERVEFEAGRSSSALDAMTEVNKLIVQDSSHIIVSAPSSPKARKPLCTNPVNLVQADEQSDHHQATPRILSLPAKAIHRMRRASR